MSLPRTPSLRPLHVPPLPDSPPSNLSEQEKEASSEHESSNASPSNLTSSEEGSKEKEAESPSSPRSPSGSGVKPRPMLRARGRATSNPVLVQPVGMASVPTSTVSTLNASVTALPSPPVSPRAKSSKSNSPDGKAADPSSTPPRLTLRTMEKSSSSSSSTSPQFSLTEQLAQFVDEQLLSKKARLNEEIEVGSLPKELRHLLERPDKTSVYLSDLMKALFRADLKKSSAWDNALQMAVKIRNEFAVISPGSTSLNSSMDPEERDSLKFCAASFSGAFFNLSTDDRLARLPASLLSFLEAADHRLIRILLSTDAGLSMSSEAFAAKRQDLLSSLLLDSFLVPIILEDIFTARGILRSDIIVGFVIAELHQSVKDIVHAFLSHSVQHAPEDVRTAFAHRRFNLLHQKSGDGKPALADSVTGSTDGKRPSHPPLSPRNPNQDRRSAVKNHFDSLLRELKLNREKIPPDLLKKIKEHNNQLATSGERFTQLSAWKQWLGIAEAWDRKSDLTGNIRAAYVDLENRMHEVEEIDSVSKYINLAEPTNPFTHTTTSMTSVTVTTATTMTATLSTTSTTLTTSTTSTTLSAPANRKPLTRMPKTVRARDVKLPSSSFSSAPLSPSIASVSLSDSLVSLSSSSSSQSRPITRHQRSHTADAKMPVVRPPRWQLNAMERQRLQQLFPALIQQAFEEAAAKHPHRIVQSIVELQRNALLLSLKDVLEGQSGDSETAVQPQHASHAELLKILVMGELESSAAGLALASARAKALAAVGEVRRVLQMESEFVRNDMLKKIQPIALAAAKTLFDKGLANAGLPPALLELWIKVDKAVDDWFGTTSSSAPHSRDELRSTMGFDLIITRLIYPLSIGADDTNPSAPALRFGTAIRAEIMKIWPDIFKQFKQLAASQATAPAQQTPGTSTGSRGDVPAPDSPEKNQ